jgi:hypothetical protein
VIGVVYTTDLRRLEREAFRKFYDDGLFDLFLGAMLGFMPLAAVIDRWADSEVIRIGSYVAVYGGLVTLFMAVRRHLLRTRLGDFKPGPERRRKITVVRLVLAGSMLVGLVGFAIGAVAPAADWSVTDLDFVMPIVWFVNATIVFSLMAHFLDVPRFHVHGVLFGSALMLREWPSALWGVEVPLGVAFGAPAAVIVGIGLVKLSQFLSNYPVVASRDPVL